MAVLTFKTRRVELDLKKIKVRQVEEFYKALNEVKDEHNPAVINPRVEIDVKDAEGIPTGEKRLETIDEWRLRVLIALSDKLDKLPDETDEQYDRRIIAINLQNHIIKVAFSYLNKVCKIMSLPEVSWEEYSEGSVEDVRNFCYDILSTLDITDPDRTFFPPLRASEIVGTRGMGGNS